jgi:folate-dependent phosphoribosylglycinamide formyltransferase PurN
MEQLVYDPSISGNRMTIVCFVSGSGTNYREIVNANRNHNYVLFTNRPNCGGVLIADQNKHEVVELSHVPYLKGVREKYGGGNVPRNCPERVEYEQEVCRLIEDKLNRKPDLICLAGYDQWVTDWMVDRYYPKILNVHPGDTTKGYDGLYWIPSAKAILAGDEVIRSTVFFVDKGEDTGPVLVQSGPLHIVKTLKELERQGIQELVVGLNKITSFIAENSIMNYASFKMKAGEELLNIMKHICKNLQEVLKVTGDWKAYPFAVHRLIAAGRVKVVNRTVYIDKVDMSLHGYRLEENN